MKTPSKIMLMLTSFILLTTTAGVAATWHYSFGHADNVETSINLGLMAFDWAGSEVLPDDVQGENHQTLINNLINSDAGMNTEGSYIDEQIDSRLSTSITNWTKKETFGSMDMRDSDDISDIFNLNTEKLSFMIYFPQDNKSTPEDESLTRYIYTTSVDLGEQSVGGGWWGSTKENIPVGQYVYPVYRTIVKYQANENGEMKWVPETSEIGAAKSAFYSNDTFGSGLVQNPAFDVTTWVAGKRGTSKDNAIYAFVGQSSNAYLDSNTEVVYYYLDTPSSGSYAVTTTNANVTITISVSSGNVNPTTTTTTDANGNQITTVSWRATGRVSYYIAMVGAEKIPFTITKK
jgi:hypothetical protein